MTAAFHVLPTLSRVGLVARVTPTVHAILDQRLGVRAALLAPHVSLGGDLAADSLDLMELLIDLESVFGIVVAVRDVDGARTVSDLVHLVARHLWERDRAEPWHALHVAA